MLAKHPTSLQKIALVLVLWPGLILPLVLIIDLVNVISFNLFSIVLWQAKDQNMFWNTGKDLALSSSTLGLCLFIFGWLKHRHYKK